MYYTVFYERAAGAGLWTGCHLHPKLLHTDGPGGVWLLHHAGVHPPSSLPLDHLQGVSVGTAVPALVVDV